MNTRAKFNASYFLADYLDLPVVDKTNLQGIYDITLKIDTIFPSSQDGARGGPGQKLPEFNPPLPKTLEDQLGLHLERTKVQVEVLVIDHLEKATEN